MPTTDPIADLIIRIRNGARVRKPYVDAPYSKMKHEMLRVLLQGEYIFDYVQVDEGPQGFLRIYLKYNPNGEPAFQGLRRVSTPGLRKYVAAGGIPRVLNGLGVAIVTTSKGIMTGGQAKKLGVGGEILAEVW